MAAVLSSCSGVVKKFSALTGSDRLATDSLVFNKEAEHANVNYYVDFPVDGNELLVNAIQEYINEQLGGTYDGDEAEGHQMVTYYGETEWNNLKGEYKEMAAESDGDWMNDVTFSAEISIRKVYESETVVTYITEGSTYEGGAHDMPYQMGVSFRKSDGRRFGYDMMRELYSEGFYRLTKEGLGRYFSEGTDGVTTDAELKEWLMTDDELDALSHPKADPYLVEEGVVFTYQPYEIAPYAAGLPKYTVSYADIRPYLTVNAQKLIAQQEKQ